MDLKNQHALHGALAGVVVYGLTKKPLPSIAVGGAAYLYMSKHGHALPGETTSQEPLADDPVTTVEIPLVPVGPISHDPYNPTILLPLGPDDRPMEPVPAPTSAIGYGWNVAPAGWTGTLQEWRDTAHLSPSTSAYS